MQRWGRDSAHYLEMADKADARIAALAKDGKVVQAAEVRSRLSWMADADSASRRAVWSLRIGVTAVAAASAAVTVWLNAVSLVAAWSAMTKWAATAVRATHVGVEWSIASVLWAADRTLAITGKTVRSTSASLGRLAGIASCGVKAAALRLAATFRSQGDPAMNGRQRIAIGIGVALVIFSGLFPPYEAEWRRSGDNAKMFLGYYFVLAPPGPHDAQRAFWSLTGNQKPLNASCSTQIVTSRVWLQLGVIVVATAGVVLLLATKDERTPP